MMGNRTKIEKFCKEKIKKIINNAKFKNDLFKAIKETEEVTEKLKKDAQVTPEMMNQRFTI